MKQLPIESWQDVRQVQAGMFSHLMYDFGPTLSGGVQWRNHCRYSGGFH